MAGGKDARRDDANPVRREVTDNTENYGRTGSCRTLRGRVVDDGFAGTLLGA